MIVIGNHSGNFLVLICVSFFPGQVSATVHQNESNGALLAEQEVSGNSANEENCDPNRQDEADNDYIPIFDESSHSDFEEVCSTAKAI